MASIERRDRNGKVNFRVHWRDPSGAQRTKTFTRKTDASRYATKVQHDLDRGRYVDHSSPMTVVEYARAYVANRPHRPASAARVANYVELHIAPTKLGDKRLVDVKPSDVQAWATERGKVPLAPSTMKNLVGLLRSVYNSAVLDRLVAASPVVRVQLPRAEKERVVPLSVPQVTALADEIRADCAAMVITQAGLGLRVGELIGLRVSDVDFLHRSVSVNCQIVSGTRERSDPKTPRSRRTLPMPTFVAEALAEHLRVQGAGADGSLFTEPSGRPWSQNAYSRPFKRAVKAAGLPAGTTSHDLRHHYASVLLAAGESVVAVAERLGHENANLVMSTYGHLMPDSEERTRAALDEAWRSPSVTPNAVTAR